MRQVENYIASNGIRMVKEAGNRIIDSKIVYSLDDVTNHTIRGWKLEKQDLEIKMWNLIRELIVDVDELEKKLENVNSDDNVKRSELKSYVFKENT